MNKFYKILDIGKTSAWYNHLDELHGRFIYGKYENDNWNTSHPFFEGKMIGKCTENLVGCDNFFACSKIILEEVNLKEDYPEHYL